MSDNEKTSINFIYLPPNAQVNTETIPKGAIAFQNVNNTNIDIKLNWEDNLLSLPSLDLQKIVNIINNNDNSEYILPTKEKYLKILNVKITDSDVIFLANQES